MSPDSYAETLTPRVMVLGGSRYQEVRSFRDDSVVRVDLS